MEKALYGFNSSQDIIHLQTKYSLWSRVANIVFSTVVENGFDKALMTEAINKVFERNDSLRITFVKKGKEIMQYFEDSRKIGTIEEKVFNLNEDKNKFIRKFRSKALNVFKGQTLEVVFAKEVDGRQSIYFKVSHYVADTYGIGVIVADLFGVYDALKSGKELPAAPASFETVLQKDLAYKANDELKKKDEEFFKEYYELRHTNRPIFCGIQGDQCDKWLKEKRKGHISMPYFFVRCDTEGYRFVIPAAVGKAAKEWCNEHQIPMSTFYFTACNIAASLVNGKESYLLPLMLLDCRGTMTERKAAGTKVQSMSVYATVDYEKSFTENITEAFADQNDLYKHTRLSYLEVEAMQRKLWNFSPLGEVLNYAFSYIPFDAPDGIEFQIHSNAKGALPAYIALMVSPRTDEVTVVYDIQTQMMNGAQLADFQSRYVHVIEAVLANSEAKLNDIL